MYERKIFDFNLAKIKETIQILKSQSMDKSNKEQGLLVVSVS